MSRNNNDISACVFGALEQYFRDLDGERPAAIYDMVMRNVEKPMLQIVLQQAGGLAAGAWLALGAASVRA